MINFQNFGKTHDGKFNERIVDYFKFELSNNLTNNDPPLIVICISNSKNIPAELGRIFLEIFEFGAPDQDERAKILEWILEEQALETDTDMKEIAGKTHGFFYGDLAALIYHARKNSFDNRSDSLIKADFETALGKLSPNKKIFLYQSYDHDQILCRPTTRTAWEHRKCRGCNGRTLAVWPTSRPK